MRKPKREGIERATIKLNGLKMDFSVDGFEYTDDPVHAKWCDMRCG